MLDFIFTCRTRGEAHCNTMYREQDYPDGRHLEQALPHLNRSGRRIQHAFNFLGLDAASNSEGFSWPLRQIIVYHSFDICFGTSLWIIIKGDNTIRKLFERRKTRFQTTEPTTCHDIQAAFLASLSTNLLFVKWCTVNWDRYFDHLEESARNIHGAVAHLPVEELTRRDSAILRLAKSDSLESSTPTTVLESNNRPNVFRRLVPFALRQQKSRSDSPASSAFTSGFRNTAHVSVGREVQARAPRVSKIQLDEVLNFDELQKLHRLFTKADQATTAIQQNKKILFQIQRKYSMLLESHNIDSTVKISSCSDDIKNFIRQVQNAESELDGFQNRLAVLLRCVEKDTAMVS